MTDLTPCAGRLSRVSNRPHPLCRNCARWQYGITGGITPRVIVDSQPSCADKVVHVNTVGDDPKVCAPTR